MQGGLDLSSVDYTVVSSAAPAAGPAVPSSTAPPTAPAAPVHVEEIDQAMGTEDAAVLGRGTRRRETSVRLRDYVAHTARKLSSSVPLPTSQQSSAITAEREPVHYSQIVKDGRWRDAIRHEIEALKANETWVVEDLPTDKKALGCKWVYKIKYNSDGTIEKLKVRLVILENHQI